MDKTSKVHFSLRSGASLIKVKPVFSHDNKYLFVCAADVVKVYSVVSGECLRQLVGHEGDVTGVITHPTNKLQILTCSEDKSVVVWDYSDGIKLKSYAIGKPVIGIFSCSSENEVFLLLNPRGKLVDNESILIQKRLTIKESRYTQIFTGCSSDVNKTAVGPKGLFCVSVLSTKFRVKDLQSKKHGTSDFEHTVESNIKFTCVAVHPNGNCVATGCCNGMIFVWYNFHTKNPTKSTLHWHSLSVREVTYTPEGSYLLSGGHECVLVKWHQQTEYRDFLPRLGAAITHISSSTDNQYYAISQDDNVVKLVSSSFSIQQVFQGLTRSDSGIIPTGLKCDPKTQALVLNGKRGHIQFYDVHEDKQLFNLDIVCQNFISPESLDKPLTYTEITHVEFDEKGDWLSTVEYWNDGQMSPEIQLKFWLFSEEKQSYTLNTTAEQAHSDKIVSLKFRPGCTLESTEYKHMVVSSGIDGKFKIWTLTDDSDIYRENVKWTCQSVGFYRDIPAGKTGFSEDGTLLAVVFDSCITLWDPDTNLLRETLITNGQQSKINEIMFGNQDCCHYLISCTDTVLTVWNLINCSIFWSADYSVISLTKDPKSNIVAAFSKERHLHVFKPSNPQPVFKSKSVCREPITSAVFIPHSDKELYNNTKLHWQKHSELYFMDVKQQLHVVSLDGSKKKAKSKDEVINIQENLPQSALSLIMKGHTNRSALRVDQKNVTLQPQDKYLKEILSSPAHVQPSLSTLCHPFLRSLLVPQRNVNDNIDDEDDEEETKHDESQTGSMDSGLDSDSDMESTVDQSEEMETQSGSHVQPVGQFQKLTEENKVKNGQKEIDLKKKNGHRQQEDRHSISDVFKKSLKWYTKK